MKFIYIKYIIIFVKINIFTWVKWAHQMIKSIFGFLKVFHKYLKVYKDLIYKTRKMIQ